MENMDEKTMQAVMGLIMYGGDAKNNAMEAIQAKKNDLILKRQKKS
ncbi:hypothetical protein IGI96_003556 [Enterococcus sp. DIV0421]